MLRFSMLVVALLMLSPSMSPAQFGGMGEMDDGSPTPRAVKVDLAGDLNVSGVLSLDTIDLDCALGRYRIRAELIASIQFQPEPGRPAPPAEEEAILLPATIATTTGEAISGALRLGGDWVLATKLGSLTLDPAKLRKLSFTGEPVMAPVTGRVLFRGEPMKGEVVFTPRDGAPVTAAIGDDGRFTAEVPAGPFGASIQAEGGPFEGLNYQANFRADAFGPNRIDVLMPMGGGMGGGMR